MDVRRRLPPAVGGRIVAARRVLAADALSLPMRITNAVVTVAFVHSSCDILRRCSDKERPLRFPLGGGELFTIVCQLASVIYLLSFFGIPFVQAEVPASDDEDDVPAPAAPMPAKIEGGDEEIVAAVVSGAVPSHHLEMRLGNCRRAARLRREALRRLTGWGVERLPFDGMDYESVLGQCCEMPVGYVQLLVGVAGPLRLDGREFYIPMATTEGCLVASVNRGCRAIAESGGAESVLLRDAMSRAPAVKMPSARWAACIKAYLEGPANFDTLAAVFNRNVYMRFTCSTGDAMGMNMVSKGVENVLNYLRNDFPDMDVVSLSGNYCADKKPAAVNWIEGRGKSVVCEATIKGELVQSVLKTNVAKLVDLNITKNLAGSAVAGALGGFNAHASNIVTALFIATGQDPAQNVESLQCITMMEAVNGGNDLHISVTMPSIEVGTIGGGTCLASQAACLNLLGVNGANEDSPGANARLLATIVAGSVLAGELSLLSALAAGKLVRSHMKYNRSSKDVSKAAS